MLARIRGKEGEGRDEGGGDEEGEVGFIGLSPLYLMIRSRFVQVVQVVPNPLLADAQHLSYLYLQREWNCQSVIVAHRVK